MECSWSDDSARYQLKYCITDERRTMIADLYLMYRLQGKDKDQANELVNQHEW